MRGAALRQVAGRESESGDRNALIAGFLRQIERAAAEGRFRFADHFCDKILAEDPRHLEAWLLKAHLARHRFHDVQTAVNCYRQVLILGGFESSNAWVAQARASLAQLLEQIA
ncbi:MAG: hypothetical protein ACM3O7_07100 [Acidobacteriota bacterium]